MAGPPPQFCPWCGTPIAFEAHEHEARHELFAEQARAEGNDPPPLPERVKEMLTGDSYVAACPGCRTISHVVGHRPPET
ncbi:MAG: hypothetical protein H0V79_10060 [Actinobacteria bacterium]|nr:hypothetical protein [Actinomycetota bacterium]